MKIRHAFLMVVIVIPFMIVGFVLALSISPLDHSLPTDDELAVTYWKYEADFQRLAEMSDRDEQVTRIASNFTWLKTNAAWPRPESEWGISKARWEEYRSLFKKLALREGITREESGDVIYFTASSVGLMTDGASKGYAFARTQPESIVDSLDDPTSWPQGKHMYFRRLKGNWYLFFSS